MAIDWTLFARYAAPVLALLVGALLQRALERRARLISFLSHASAVKVQTPQGPLDVFGHAIVVRNGGRKPAVNVRLGHRVLPDFSVYPSIPYQVAGLPGGGAEIVFPALVPDEQVVVNYLYLPPTIWSDVNTYTKSEEGFARIINVLPTPQPPRWALVVGWLLLAVGTATVAYAGVEFVTWLVHLTHGGA